MNNVIVLWDIENVTPPGSNTLFIDGLWDYAESLGRVTASYAYADWSKPGFKKLGPALSNKNFYMVHVPRQRKTKNSADMMLVSDAMEILRFRPHIDTYILITGDSDFRPLLQTLRRAGKMIHIICDIKTAAQDLLAIADSFTDFREVIPGGEDEVQDQRDPQDEHTSNPAYSRQYWFECLGETANILEKENKNTNLGSVKIKMKMLNHDFDEKKLGYKRWLDFVTDAVSKGYVKILEKDDQPYISISESSSQVSGYLQNALLQLIKVLEELDGGSCEPQYHQYSIISTALKKRNIDTHILGFSKFKRFMQSAEARGLIESKVENIHYYARRS